MATQLHHFDDDGEFGINVKTEKLPNGEYAAIDADNYDGPGSPMGLGFSLLSAIADLFEQLPRAASEREERDDRAVRFDRAREYLKHEAAE